MSAVAAVEVDGLVEDRSVWPTLTRLAACLCTELSIADLPETCFCGVLPGDTAALDYVTDKAGMGWVRLDNAFPASSFPTQTVVNTCTAPLAFQIEVGTAFCAPTFSDARGNPPSVAVMLDTARIQMAAMAAARRAIVCCPGIAARDLVLGSYQPFGPDGAVVGGTWQVWVAEQAVRRG